MSINTMNSNSLSPEATLDKAIGQILQGYSDDALARLTKCGFFSDEQIAKIQAVLMEVKPTHPATTPRALKDRILEALNPETPSIQILPSKDKIDHLCFTETSTFEFASAYPCKIEFGGKHYSNAVACFLAQQYIDQPQIMELLTQCETAEEALFLCATRPMTKERKLLWENPHAEHINKNDVMMHVLRAKFGQNPELKEKLKATCGMYLVAQGNDPYWNDGFNGTGENKLGIALMCLRREYDGTGIVEPNIGYNNLILDLKDKCHFHMFELNEDIIYEIFKRGLSVDNGRGALALAFTNKHFYKHITKIADQFDLKEICPSLTILDANTLGIRVDDEPSISKFALLKCYLEMVPHVEDNAGLTLLTMTKDLALNRLKAIGKDSRIDVHFSWSGISIELGDVRVEHTYRVLITNNVIINSRNKSYDKQDELLVEIGCEMPTVQEYAALCIFTKLIFKKCLYGENPRTFGRSSTKVVGYSSFVGSFSPNTLNIDTRHPCGPFVNEICGIGGVKKRATRSRNVG